MAHLSETPLATTGLFSGWFSEIAEARKIRRIRRQAYRQTFNELNMMSDAELNDIGLSGYMIRDVALQAAEMAAPK